MKLINSTDYADYFLRRMVAWCCKQMDCPVRIIRKAHFRNRSESYSGHAWGSAGRIVVSIGGDKYSYEVTVYRKNGEPCRYQDMPADNKQFRDTLMFRGGKVTLDGNLYERVKEQRFKENWPTSPDKRPGMQGEHFEDRLEALVAVTAHEIYHVAAYADDEHRQRTRGAGKRFASSEQRTRHEEVRVLRLFRAERAELVAAWSAEQVKSEKPKPSIQEQRAAKVEQALAKWQRKLKLAQTKIKKLKQRARYYQGAIAAKSPPQEQP